MSDIFDNDILCKRCHLKMEKGVMNKNGFDLRFVKCSNCGDKVMHPSDVQEYKQFDDLKQKQFRVKLRLVGNSYAVSIPKEIVDFIKEQDDVFNNMVNLCFEEMNRISLMFDDSPLRIGHREAGENDSPFHNPLHSPLRRASELDKTEASELDRTTESEEVEEDE